MEKIKHLVLLPFLELFFILTALLPFLLKKSVSLYIVPNSSSWYGGGVDVESGQRVQGTSRFFFFCVLGDLGF